MELQNKIEELFTRDSFGGDERAVYEEFKTALRGGEIRSVDVALTHASAPHDNRVRATTLTSGLPRVVPRRTRSTSFVARFPCHRSGQRHRCF